MGLSESPKGDICSLGDAQKLFDASQQCKVYVWTKWLIYLTKSGNDV